MIHQITLQQIGKRFRREWIFKDMDYTFESGRSYAILGNNGSGKSTLLKILSGSVIPSKGKITYFNQAKNVIDGEEAFQYISWAAPYLSLIEEFSLSELIDFQGNFKPFRANLSNEAVADLIALPNVGQKSLKYYSSGMLQRVKLALAILADTSVLLLDEPTSNLDVHAIQWYQNLLNAHAANRLILLASNQKEEYVDCDVEVDVRGWK